MSSLCKRPSVFQGKPSVFQSETQLSVPFILHTFPSLHHGAGGCWVVAYVCVRESQADFVRQTSALWDLFSSMRLATTLQEKRGVRWATSLFGEVKVMWCWELSQAYWSAGDGGNSTSQHHCHTKGTPELTQHKINPPTPPFHLTMKAFQTILSSS